MAKDIKLVELAKKLNVGVRSLQETLEQKALLEAATPNTRVGRQIAEQLIQEHGKGLPREAIEQIKQELFAPVKQEASPRTETKLEPKAEVEAAPQPHKQEFKVVGHIEDLNKRAQGDPQAKPKVEVKPEVKPEAKKEEAKPAQYVEPQPQVKEEPKVEVKPETKPQTESKSTPKIETEPKPAVPPVAEAEAKPAPSTETLAPATSEAGTTETEGGIFRHTTPEGVQLKVVGKIDLSSINDSMRPAKKTRAERNKENNERKKRARINKSAVDVKAEVAKANDGSNKKASTGKNGMNGKGSQPNSDRNQRNGQGNGSANKNDRKGKKQKAEAPKAVVTDEDVQRQVKETLARLTGKSPQSGKSAKYRRDKRDAARSAAQDAQEAMEQESRTLKLTEFVTVSDLANMMDVPVTKVIATCMSVGLMVSINMRLDAETIDLVAEEFGFQTEFVSAEVVESIGQEEEDSEEDLTSRPPIVTVMGHVDHGKTSLLDRLRNTNVIAGEAGGITQHIGAYSLKLSNGKRITFLDTPGHEAFTAMRARGAKITDIAIIIVAADDDVMPQTKEAINHAAAAGVPIVFAINKIDKPAANPDRIREQLAAMNYLVEDWGGKYQCQEISAKQGINIDELLEKVLLEAELLELKANSNRRAIGSVIESSLDKGRGYVTTIMVQNGTLNNGDIVLAGTFFGRVKAMFNERNQKVQQAGPSTPVLILGLNGAPTAGETFNVIETEQEARSIANKREQLKREQDNRTKKGLTLDELARRRALGNFQELNVIIKGDVDGSIEALSDSLIRLSTEEIQVNVIHKGVGAISESDVVLASASSAIIIGFQVRPMQAAKRKAEAEGVEIRTYSIIYDTIEDIKSAMEGMLSPEIKENVVANLEVQQTFKITKVGTIAGCIVLEGKIKRSNKIRLIRDGIVKYSGALGSLKRFKDDAKEVVMGQDCGLNIDGYNDIMVGDVIEAYEEIEIKKTLD